MFHFHECPNCKKEAERDADDERRGASFGGHFSLDPGKPERSMGGGGASYVYNCPHCATRFRIDHNYEIVSGVYREWDTTYVYPKQPQEYLNP